MKKVGLLLLAMILALGGLGVGYAMWYQTLTISGDVSTGSVCWEFCNQRFTDHSSPEGSGYVWTPQSPFTEEDWLENFADYTTNDGFEGGFTRLDKNVAWGTCRILNDEGLEDTHGKTIELTMHNVYPSNFNEFGFYVQNCGTLPLRIANVKFLDNNGEVIATLTENGYVALDLNNDDQADCPDIEISYKDNFDVEIEAGWGCDDSPEYSFWIHTLQCAPQGKDLTFSIEITAVQFNEYGEEIPE